MELLFGYADELLARLASVLPTLIPSPVVALTPNMTSRAEALALPHNQMATHPHRPLPTWEYVSWMGRTEVSCWNKHKEAVRGSDALQFAPGLTAEDSVHVFVPELFRSAKLNVTGTVRCPPLCCIVCLLHIIYLQSPLFRFGDGRWFGCGGCPERQTRVGECR